MGFLSNILNRTRQVEQTVVEEIQKVEIIIDDAKMIFEKARQEALDANAEVNRIKADLQAALVKARDLHQAVIDLANKAAEAAAADVNRFKAAALAHAADARTQDSQVIPTPSADTTAVDEPSTN